MTWVVSYIHHKELNVITHPCPNLSGSLTQLKIQSAHNFVHRWTDRRTVKVKPVYFHFVERGYTSRGIPIVEIRQSYNHLISKMGFPILVRWHLYTASGDRSSWYWLWNKGVICLSWGRIQLPAPLQCGEKTRKCTYIFHVPSSPFCTWKFDKSPPVSVTA